MERAPGNVECVCNYAYMIKCPHAVLHCDRAALHRSGRAGAEAPTGS